MTGGGTDDWVELAYMLLMLVGAAALGSLAMHAVRAVALAVAGWWVGRGEERAALDRIADVLERYEERHLGRLPSSESTKEDGA